MAKSEVIRFFDFLAHNPLEKSRLASRNLHELLFHAKTMNFSFSESELSSVIGAFEWFIITSKDKEELDAYSSLWLKMWGLSRLDYVITELYNNLSEEEIQQIIAS